MTIQKHSAHQGPRRDSTKIVLQRNQKEMVFNVPIETYLSGLEKYQDGALIQDAFSFLSADQREFLQSGLFPSEFEALFGEGER